MPNAYSYLDGTISYTTSKAGPNLRNTITFQALPRVSGSFRYSGIGDRPILWIDKSNYAYWDRSFDLRVNIIPEGKILPELTFGLKDFIGTGVYSSEYLVASKNILNSFTMTGGLGFGRLGSKNIIGKFGERAYKVESGGGSISTGHFFRGDVGLLGGLEYQTKNKKINLKIELSSDSYKRDSIYSQFKNLPTSQINYGLEYNFDKNISLSGYKVLGHTYGLQLNLKVNPNIEYGGNILENAPQPFYFVPFPEEKEKIYWEKITLELKKEKIRVIGHKVDKNEAIVIIENNKFSTNVQAIGRTLRIMSKYIPRKYVNFTVVMTEVEIPLIQVSFDRTELENIVDAPNSEIFSQKIANFSSSPKQIEVDALSQVNKKFNYRISPYYRIHLFDPDNPIYYEIGAELEVDYTPRPGMFLSTQIRKPLVSDFDKIWRGSKGNLPKVRTNLKHYLNEQKTRIDHLTLASYSKISKNLYSRVTLGILENMYSGASLEALRFNPSSKINYGIELNHVKARDYRQLFKTIELNGLSKTNGHLTTYIDTGYYFYNAQLDIGKYLAGDKGATLTLTRDYPNGWEMGGFFTLTDAPFKDFGEGRFDKGFFIKIPINPIVPYETKSFIYEKVKPIQGDGGARLVVPGRLYGILKNYSENKIQNSWPKIWR